MILCLKPGWGRECWWACKNIGSSGKSLPPVSHHSWSLFLPGIMSFLPFPSQIWSGLELHSLYFLPFTQQALSSTDFPGNKRVPQNSRGKCNRKMGRHKVTPALEFFQNPIHTNNNEWVAKPRFRMTVNQRDSMLKRRKLGIRSIWGLE